MSHQQDGHRRNQEVTGQLGHRQSPICMSRDFEVFMLELVAGRKPGICEMPLTLVPHPHILGGPIVQLLPYTAQRPALRKGRIVICLRTRALVWIPLLLTSLAFGQNGALRIVEPKLAYDHTIMTSEPSIHLKGTFAWTGGDTRVLWKNERGFSDLATVKLADDQRTVEWSTTTPIPLRPGINQLRIRALNQPGAGESLNVYYSVQSPEIPARQGTTMFKGQPIVYEEIDGQAVYQSDMILGPLNDVKAGRFAGRMANGGMHLRPQSLTITPNPSYASGLW